jgi:predicted phosphoadenosine phosphosulfate sulfurtransferase
MMDSLEPKLYTETLGGNVHEAAQTINKLGLAKFVVSLSFNGGNYSTALFRMPAHMVWELRKNKPSFDADVHFDDEILG